MDWPWSIGELDAVGVPGWSAVFTFMTGVVAGEDDTERVSVTVTLNWQLVVVPDTGLYTNELVFPGLLNPGHVPTVLQEYASAPVPPEPVAETVMLCPSSRVIGDVGVFIETVGSVFTVSVSHALVVPSLLLSPLYSASQEYVPALEYDAESEGP